MNTEKTPQKKEGISFGWILVLFFALLFILILFQNQQDVEWVFLWKKISLPFSLVITIVFGLGLFTGVMLLLPGRWKLYRKHRALKKQLEQQTKEDHQN